MVDVSIIAIGIYKQWDTGSKYSRMELLTTGVEKDTENQGLQPMYTA